MRRRAAHDDRDSRAGEVARIPAPAQWGKPCSNTESTLHQLSPYIGKMKSSIAGWLVEQFSKPGDLIVDPFAGSGTVLVEALARRRSAFGIDRSRYAEVLIRAKLDAPPTLPDALRLAERRLQVVERTAVPDLRRVPDWVRAYFHPRTLKEALAFSQACIRRSDYFNLACLLGILHHQRPGFLSYPSSHLVPYLRDKKFPRRCHPELYTYRPLRSRLLAKIERAYRRPATLGTRAPATFIRGSAVDSSWPSNFACVITSPPYMNALDYERDNRLRLWFANGGGETSIDETSTKGRGAFESLMTTFADRLVGGLAPGGNCVVVVAEQVRRSFQDSPVHVFQQIVSQRAPKLHLQSVVVDAIPDIRRSRRELQGVRNEHVLLFRNERASA